MIDASDILKVTKAVTAEWTKQRKAEDRGNRSSRSREYVYSDRVEFTAVTHQILPKGYLHASGNSRYSVFKRQLYYAVREDFRKLTGREIKADYFSNTLLVQYRNRHPETESWKIVADPRGMLTIPNGATEHNIPCGTLQIEDHLHQIGQPVDPFDFNLELDAEWPSLAGGQRYHGVLYIEKQGFEPQIKEARIAERFDLAILACKGQSVVAARQFVDEVCRVNGGVPLFVVHDFDKAGFEISQRLTRVSEWAELNDRVTYRFKNEINVTDLGLRLEDVEKYDLATEEVGFTGGFASDSICTQREREFLQSGRRVELNAFTSPQFIEWLDNKLTEQGLTKRLIPDDETLHAAYRRALVIARLNAVLDDAVPDAIEAAQEARVPKSLRRLLRSAMKGSPEPWDRILFHLVKSKLYRGDEK
jgi:hypothetical protein